MEYILIAVLAVALAALILLIVIYTKRNADTAAIEAAGRAAEDAMEAMRRAIDENQRLLRLELAESTERAVRGLGETIINEQERAALRQESRFKTFSADNELRLENVRLTVERRLSSIQEDNNKKLDEMKSIVDEKLQKTLEERMTRSFNLVSERLEQVYKGLGEMQTLAAGVGDLSKVLSNVKTRGILGEIQLGAILGEILAPEQYFENCPTVEGSSERVEFAVKIPARDGEYLLLPIDSKFPLDAYTALEDAYETGEKQTVAAAQEAFRRRVRGFAKDIRKKYIGPPVSTDFAIMFLPTEGIYAEVVRLGMMETLQSESRVNVAGPSTMAALLNSLQMGFRSVAIQKRSGEVWRVLGEVRTEFDTFEKVLTDAQTRLARAGEDLDRLIGVRTRAIKRKLKNVTAMPAGDGSAPQPLLPGEEFREDDGE